MEGPADGLPPNTICGSYGAGGAKQNLSSLREKELGKPRIGEFKVGSAGLQLR